MDDVPADLRRELDLLTEAQRAEAVGAYRRRARAADLGARLGLDPGDVYHQLRQLERSPLERLQRGLAHGHRRRVSE